MRNFCAKSRKRAHATCQGPGQHPDVLPRGAGWAVSRAIVASCPQAQGRPDTEVRTNERWAPQTVTSEPHPIVSRQESRVAGLPLVVTTWLNSETSPLQTQLKHPGHDETLRFLTKRIRMEWTHTKSDRNFIIHVMQHKNDPEWLRTVVLPVAQQQNLKNHHDTTTKTKTFKFTAFRLHPNRLRTPADNTGRYGALSDVTGRYRSKSRTVPDAMGPFCGRYGTPSGSFYDKAMRICKNV